MHISEAVAEQLTNHRWASEDALVLNFIDNEKVVVEAPIAIPGMEDPYKIEGKWEIKLSAHCPMLSIQLPNEECVSAIIMKGDTFYLSFEASTKEYTKQA